jgi:hypothetical protein
VVVVVLAVVAVMVMVMVVDLREEPHGWGGVVSAVRPQ